MAKQGDQWMPLYVADYLADTGRLTTEGHGAYLLLLMDYWRNGPPPDDDAVLASICRLPIPRWRTLRAGIRPFFRVEDGRWHQKRADSERERTAQIIEQRAKAGRASAAKRQRGSNTCSTGEATAKATEPPTNGQTKNQEPRTSTGSLKDSLNSPERAPRALKTKSADTRDPATRRHVWEQKVQAYITAHWSQDRAQRAITAYLEGTDEGKAEFERASLEMQSVRTDDSIRPEAHTTKDELLSDSLDGMALIRAAMAKTGGTA